MIILNEREYAERCITDGTVGKKPYDTLMILAKYYYALGHKKKDIVVALNEFMESNYPRYNIDRNAWIDSIDRIVKKAEGYTLYENQGVWITQSEFDKIAEIKTKDQRLLMFTLLCLAKLGNLRYEKNNGWVNNDRKEIFKLARVSCSVADRDFRLGDLRSLGYLEQAKKNGNLSVRVTFIDDSSEKKLFVDDFRELGYVYRKYCGENYIKCSDCGILFRNSKSGNRKYCNNCQGYMRQDKKKIVCIDCGKEFIVNSMNNRSRRCKSCQHKKQLEYQKISMAKIRDVK